MSAELRIPKLGVSMTEGAVTEWLVEDGARVTEGQPVYILATDKTETEIEAPAGGVLTQVAEVDVTYDVGTLVGTLR